MLDKSGEFFLKLFVSIMHIVYDFKRVQLFGSYWWVPGGVPGRFLVGSGRFLVGSAGFWSVLVLVYAFQLITSTIKLSVR